jgi:hypothetical protein
MMRSLSFASTLLLMGVLRIKAFAPSMPVSSADTTTTSRGIFYSTMNTSRRYANSADPQMSDFSRRMRSIAVPKKLPQHVAAPGRPSNVMEITTLQDYKKHVADEKDRIVVVRFYAKWCRVSS